MLNDVGCISVLPSVRPVYEVLYLLLIIIPTEQEIKREAGRGRLYRSTLSPALSYRLVFVCRIALRE